MSKPASPAFQEAFHHYCQALEQGYSPVEAQHQVHQFLGDRWTASVAKSLSRKLRQQNLPRPGLGDHTSFTEAERQIRQVIRDLQADLRRFRQHEREEYALLMQERAAFMTHTAQNGGRRFETFSPTEAQDADRLATRPGRTPSLRWLYDMAVYTAPVTAWNDRIRRHRAQYAQDRDVRLHEAKKAVQHILAAVSPGSERGRLWQIMVQAWPVSWMPDTPVVTAWIPRAEPIHPTRERVVELDTWGDVDYDEPEWTPSTAGSNKRNSQGHRWSVDWIAAMDR